MENINWNKTVASRHIEKGVSGLLLKSMENLLKYWMPKGVILKKKFDWLFISVLVDSFSLYTSWTHLLSYLRLNSLWNYPNCLVVMHTINHSM